MNDSVPEPKNTAYEPVETSPPQIDELEAETTNFTEDVWSTDTVETEIDEEIVFEVAPPKVSPAESIATPIEPTNTEDISEVAPPKVSQAESIAPPVEPTDTEDTNKVIAEAVESIIESKPEPEPELFVDTWLDENKEVAQNNLAVESSLSQLEQQKTALEQEVADLRANKERLLSEQRQAQESMGRLIEEGTQELQERKTSLRIEIDKLERRKERIEREMRSNFAGSSKELAIRVQGFKEYLVGSLQDLATAAEKLELGRGEAAAPRRERVSNPDSSRSTRDRDDNSRSRNNRDRDRDRTERRRRPSEARARGGSERSDRTQFSEPTFADHSRRIRQLLDKYCNSPDYYGAPWQLRRTFDQNQAKKVQEWFFSQGGRGAIDSTGSRLQNILVASATVSILHDIYRDRTQVLILTDTPEKLGEWRKGLEDCLGISRRDFGANRGVVLFDSPEILVQRAERLLDDKLLPIIIIDETEEMLNLSVLKFPIWLAFASSNKPSSSNYLY